GRKYLRWMVCKFWLTAVALSPSASHPAALPHGFKQDDGGRLRDIQGIDLTRHGDADAGLTLPRGAYASVFCSKDQGTGETQVRVGVEPIGSRRGGEELQRALLQPGLRLRRGGYGQRDSTEGALAGADDVGIPDVGRAVADDQAGHAGGIGRAQDSAQVAG